MRKFTQRILLCSLLCFCVAMVSAQQKKLTGTVKDTNGAPVTNASVVVKGSTAGVSTNADGDFTINVNNANSVLVISSVNFKNKEVAVGQSSHLDVVLEQGSNIMEEVVVTALGIKRAKKSLGYAVQEVGGQTLVDAKEPNLVNALSGQVAGLQVVRSSNGPAGSSKIVLRGNNSLTGTNQPLIVVDGVPVDNFTGASNNDYWNPSLDMGNGLSDINADDIESLSVLKGPSASALYGSRAGNGVILITTKSGKKQKGLGLTISSSLGVESIFANPKLQDVFGQGKDGIASETSNLSWGPKATVYDNVGNYFNNGITSNQSISFQQQLGGTSIYSSYNHLDDKSMIPGVKLTRDNLLARSISKFGANNKWTTDTKIQYSNANAMNRPIGGNNSSNSFFTLYMLPRSLDITKFKNPTDEFGNMVWYGGSNQINPYWMSQYNLNNDVRDRFIMNGSVKYDFTSWLNAEVRGGMDMYNTNTEGKTYSGSPLTATGRYSTGKQSFAETNFSGLLSAKKDDLFGKFGGNVTLGGNVMSQKFSSLSGNSGELVVPNLFSLNNGVSSPTVDEGHSQRKINSLFGSVQFSWDNYLFLDVTARNDWSSTLSKANRSFFYPSVSLSYVFTDMIKGLPEWISYGKLRGSYASVGNDLEPYKLYNTYGIGKDPNGNTTAWRNDVLLDPNVKSELIKSYEFGTELRFVNNRIGLDFSWYKSNATRQLISLPMDPLSGYTAKLINAGDIQNKGIELMLNGRILDKPGGLNWNATVNYSTNNNTVNALRDGIDIYPLGGYDDVKVLAVVGQKYGEIYGSQ
ncbi:MAG TPA: SusC/RagA family TonB-linked outer membrane protein, partial [Hanamia sp.]|nr:SusC/RagA family TonB-linked outer membrane protein [Hanamia sp.]